MSLLVGVDDCSSESDVIIIPSALDFVSQDEMLTPLGRLDKYAASENIFNRCVFFINMKGEKGVLAREDGRSPTRGGWQVSQCRQSLLLLVVGEFCR